MTSNTPGQEPQRDGRGAPATTTRIGLARAEPGGTTMDHSEKLNRLAQAVDRLREKDESAGEMIGDV